jgi:hypothetical protein
MQIFELNEWATTKNREKEQLKWIHLDRLDLHKKKIFLYLQPDCFKWVEKEEVEKVFLFVLVLFLFFEQ